MAKKETWQPKEWWPMECDTFEDFRRKLTAPPAGYELYSWSPRPPCGHFYLIMFKRKEKP